MAPKGRYNEATYLNPLIQRPQLGSGSSIVVTRGGWAAAHEDSRNERRRGVYLPSERRFLKERVCEGVVILETALALAQRGHLRIRWVGEHMTSPQWQRVDSRGSEGQKCVM